MCIDHFPPAAYKFQGPLRWIALPVPDLYCDGYTLVVWVCGDFLNCLNLHAAVTWVTENRPIMTSSDLDQRHHHPGKAWISIGEHRTQATSPGVLPAAQVRLTLPIPLSHVRSSVSGLEWIFIYGINFLWLPTMQSNISLFAATFIFSSGIITQYNAQLTVKSISYEEKAGKWAVIWGVYYS